LRAIGGRVPPIAHFRPLLHLALPPADDGGARIKALYRKNSIHNRKERAGKRNYLAEALVKQGARP
jgi:hypothetical protein